MRQNASDAANDNENMSNQRSGDDDRTRVEIGAEEDRAQVDGTGSDRAADELARIGPYRLVRLLGRGGMGAVYLAEQLEPVQRQVALKLISGTSGKGVASAFFEVERQMLARMQHPSIAQVYDAGTTDEGRPWFAMELVTGQPVTRYCEQNALDRTARIRLFCRICQGVQHAHHRGIIHRDLKPANVLVTEVDGDPHPKIIDFGVATSVVDDGTGRMATISNHAGTLAYMSPEQGAGNSVELDTRTDVYSLGVILFELLTRRRPPESTQRDALDSFCHSLTTSWRHLPPADARHSDSIRKALDSASNLAAELRFILAKALAPERENRYESPAELARDLERFVEGEMVAAVPQTRRYRWRKLLWKHRFPLVAGSLISISLVAGLVVALWSLVQVQVERDHARAAAERAEQTAGFVTGMLDSIDPEYADGADTELMLRVLDDAAQRAELELADQPMVLADIESTIGRAYRAIAEFEPAREHLERVITITEGVEGLADLNAQAHRLLADIEGEVGEAEQGLERIDALLERVAGDYPEDHVMWLEMSLSRATLLQQLSRPDAAEEHVLEVIAHSEDRQDPALERTYFEALRTLGQIHSDRMETDQADAVYRKLQDALEGWESPAARSMRLSVLNDHAVAFLRARKYAEAEPLLKKAIEGQARLYGEKHPRMIIAINNLGGSLRQQGKVDQALPYYRQAIALSIDVYGQEHPRVAIAKFNLGNGYQDLDDYERAVELHREAIPLAEQTMPDNTYALGWMRYGLGKSELGVGNAERAVTLLEQAVSLLSEAVGSEHERTEEAREALASALAEWEVADAD